MKVPIYVAGFSAADYDDDTVVKIAVKCTDGFGLVMEDEILLHGKSILEFSQFAHIQSYHHSLLSTQAIRESRHNLL